MTEILKLAYLAGFEFAGCVDPSRMYIRSLPPLALTRVMVSMVVGIPTWDPAVFGAVALLLGAVGLFAAYVPSIRATRVDPVEALRA